MPDDYQHNVFISYKRDPIQDAWLRDHFVRLFSAAVREEIAGACGRLPAGIFFDQAVISDENRQFDLNGIDPGQQWRDALADALKSSRCLVALWSPLYFFSEWCKTEWTTFRKRSDQLRRDLVIGDPLSEPLPGRPGGRSPSLTAAGAPNQKRRAIFAGRHGGTCQCDSVAMILRPRALSFHAHRAPASSAGAPLPESL